MVDQDLLNPTDLQRTESEVTSQGDGTQPEFRRKIVTVHMDVPGVSRDQIEIELVNDTLTVRGERPYPYGDDQRYTWLRIERGFGRFERELRVPPGLDPAAVEAALVEGVLSLRIPKPETLKPHRIEIKDGDGQATLEGASA